MNRIFVRSRQIASLKPCFRHILLLWTLGILMATSAQAGEYVNTPYLPQQKVVFDIFHDHPDKIASSLFWVRSLYYTLNNAPYDVIPEDMDIKIVIHGTEIVTLVKNKYKKYKGVVERLRYYTELGAEVKVCAIAARDFGLKAEDFHDFVQVVPNAIAEIAHWQQKGYALMIPQVMEKTLSKEELLE